MSFAEDDYLLLSGIQHYAFCRRQWALIHIENLWAEDLRTTEGKLLHKRAHDTSVRERHGNVITVRGVSVSSSALGVSGQSLPTWGGWIEIGSTAWSTGTERVPPHAGRVD